MQHGSASVGVALRTMAKKFKVDSAWFRQQFADKKSSYRAFAQAHGLDPSAVSRMLTGFREMQQSEALALANFLHAPISEILKHAGVEIDGEPTPIPLVATINEKGHIERLQNPRPLPPSIIRRAQQSIDAMPNVVAAQIRALHGPLTVLDDAVALFAHTDDVEASAIGVLSICRNFDGEQILAKIERARKTGESRIVSIDGKVMEFDLQTATPILAIIP